MRVIERSGQTYLCQRVTDEGDLEQRYVRKGAVLEDGLVPVGSWMAGQPYGDPWEKLATPVTVTPELIAAALRQANIWTLEDLVRDANAAQKALWRAIDITLIDLRRAAAARRKE